MDEISILKKQVGDYQQRLANATLEAVTYKSHLEEAQSKVQQLEQQLAEVNATDGTDEGVVVDEQGEPV